tara:strand:+ start:12986 stop:13972 length:987 start_codon:yes stop_codon:yes gene_type:complete
MLPLHLTVTFSVPSDLGRYDEESVHAALLDVVADLPIPQEAVHAATHADAPFAGGVLVRVARTAAEELTLRVTVDLCVSDGVTALRLGLGALDRLATVSPLVQKQQNTFGHAVLGYRDLVDARVGGNLSRHVAHALAEVACMPWHALRYAVGLAPPPAGMLASLLHYFAQGNPAAQTVHRRYAARGFRQVAHDAQAYANAMGKHFIFCPINCSPKVAVALVPSVQEALRSETRLRHLVSTPAFRITMALMKAPRLSPATLYLNGVMMFNNYGKHALCATRLVPRTFKWNLTTVHPDLACFVTVSINGVLLVCLRREPRFAALPVVEDD